MADDGLPVWISLTDLAAALRPPNRRPRSWRRQVGRVLESLNVPRLGRQDYKYFVNDLKNRAPAIVEEWEARRAP